MIDAATDEHLWAERYDRTLDDAFAIQSDVAQRVVRSCPTGPTKNDTGGGEAQSAVLAAPLAPPEAARVGALAWTITAGNPAAAACTSYPSPLDYEFATHRSTGPDSRCPWQERRKLK